MGFPAEGGVGEFRGPSFFFRDEAREGSMIARVVRYCFVRGAIMGVCGSSADLGV